ncbi:MAG: hypothetical protein JWM65_265 [Sphingomonas bacterium]|nr:hypothetical protein [Sphingomonas bacterium]
MLGDQALQQDRALAMPDQHDAAAVIVMREIPRPGRLDIVIGHVGFDGFLARHHVV